MTLTVSNWDLPVVSLVISLGLSVSGEGQMEFTLRIKGTCSADDITVDVALDHLAEVGFVKFLTVTSIFSPVHSVCTLWKDVTACRTHLRSWEVMLHFSDS